MHANPNRPRGERRVTLTADDAELIRHALVDRFREFAETAVGDLEHFWETEGRGPAAADAASNVHELEKITSLLERTWWAAPDDEAAGIVRPTGD